MPPCHGRRRNRVVQALRVEHLGCRSCPRPGTTTDPRGDGVVGARLDAHVVGRVGGEEVDRRAGRAGGRGHRRTAGVAAEQAMVAEDPQVARLGRRLRRVARGCRRGRSRPTRTSRRRELRRASPRAPRTRPRRRPAVRAASPRRCRPSRRADRARPGRAPPPRAERSTYRTGTVGACWRMASATRRCPSTTWPVRRLTSTCCHPADLAEDPGRAPPAAPSDGGASWPGWRGAGRAPPRPSRRCGDPRRVPAAERSVSSRTHRLHLRARRASDGGRHARSRVGDRKEPPDARADDGRDGPLDVLPAVHRRAHHGTSTPPYRGLDADRAPDARWPVAAEFIDAMYAALAAAIEAGPERERGDSPPRSASEPRRRSAP